MNVGDRLRRLFTWPPAGPPRDPGASQDAGPPPPGVSPERYARWRAGNEDEKRFWRGLPEAVFRDQASGYRACAACVMDRLRAHGIRPDYRALQIGCAVEDVIFYMEGGQRYAIDPLGEFYKAHFQRARHPEVDYRTGMGEVLPFEHACFDVVICQNVLDHVADCDAVLREIGRVLRRPNLVYFGTDVYDEAIAVRRRALKRRSSSFDIQHPYQFSEGGLEALVESHGFAIAERFPRQPSGKGDESWRHCFFATWSSAY